jgi:hypothetical protein
MDWKRFLENFNSDSSVMCDVLAGVRHRNWKFCPGGGHLPRESDSPFLPYQPLFDSSRGITNKCASSLAPVKQQLTVPSSILSLSLFRLCIHLYSLPFRAYIDEKTICSPQHPHDCRIL